MLDFQLKQAPFKYGIAEGDDPHALPMGVLTRLDNYVWKKTGRVEKRQGVVQKLSAIIAGGALSSVKRLFTRNSGNELCVMDGTNLYSLSLNGWTAVAAVPDVGLLQSPLIDPLLGVQVSDTAVSGDFVCTCFVAGDPTNPVAGNAYLFIKSLSTGAVLLPPTNVFVAASGIRCIIIGSTLVLVTAGAGANIRALTYNLTTLTPITGATLRNDRNGAGFQNWDARAIGGSSDFVLAYEIGAGGTRVERFDANLTTIANVVQGGGAFQHLAVEATSGEAICVVWSDNVTNVNALIADPTTMANVVAPFLVEAAVTCQRLGVCRYDANNFAVTYTNLVAVGGTSIGTTISRLITRAGALVALTRRSTAGTILTSNPFMNNGKCYAYVLNSLSSVTTTLAVGTFIGNSAALLGIYPGADDGTVVTDLTHPMCATVDILLGSYASSQSPLTRISPVSSTRAIGSIPFIGTAPSGQFTWRTALRLMDVTAGSDVPIDLWRTVSRGAETFISGPVLSVYDGADVFDYGFIYAPVFLTQATAGAGGVILAGNYIYGAHLEYRAASGLLYRGPTVRGPALTTAGATSKNTLRFVQVNVGNKKHLMTERFGTSLPVYRTVVNGTIPQRLTEEPSFNLSPVVYGSASQLFNDTVADAAIDTNATTLASRPAMYTEGGVLDDQQAPASVTMFAHADRLWVLASDKQTWWYSKAFNDDIGTAPGFNFAFRIVMPQGDQSCGISMDEHAIFFSTTGISYMQGLGPAKDGTGSDFSAPVRIQTDVGCNNARSVVGVPDGVMFQSPRGLHLLDRGLAVNWIGKEVLDKLTDFPNITSAVLVAKRNEVRFTANDAAGTFGIVLVYNYVEKQWSTSSYIQDSQGRGIAIADACIYLGEWTFATGAGAIYTETSASNLDVTAYVPGVIETAWISAAGPLAYHSVRNFWMHGVSHTDHDLTIDVAFDSNTAYQQTAVFRAGSAVTAVSSLEEFMISIGKRRKCNSIRFRITDTAPLTPGTLIGIGTGPSFETMAIEVGVIDGDNTAARRKG